jgi:hypothetical protein
LVELVSYLSYRVTYGICVMTTYMLLFCVEEVHREYILFGIGAKD